MCGNTFLHVVAVVHAVARFSTAVLHQLHQRSAVLRRSAWRGQTERRSQRKKTEGPALKRNKGPGGPTRHCSNSKEPRSSGRESSTILTKPPAQGSVCLVDKTHLTELTILLKCASAGACPIQASSPGVTPLLDAARSAFPQGLPEPLSRRYLRPVQGREKENLARNSSEDSRFPFRHSSRYTSEDEGLSKITIHPALELDSPIHTARVNLQYRRTIDLLRPRT